MKLTLGPVQDAILKALFVGASPASMIAQRVYNTKVPTKSQMVSTRRALRALEKQETVRLTSLIFQRERCWEATGKMAPLPKRKAPLAVVK